MRILVTGVTGYIGSRLSLSLAGEGNIVHALVRNPNSAFFPRHENIWPIVGDINDADTIAKAVKGCEQVYHAAALASLHPKDTSRLYDVNLEGTRNMLEQSLRAGVRRFLFTSSCSVYASSGSGIANEEALPPIRFVNHYERSKFLADELMASYAESILETVTVHLSRVFGPGPETHAMSVSQLIRRCAMGKICICPKPLSIVSNYTFIDDVVRGHILAMKNGRVGERYILGGENLSYQTFFEILAEVFERKALPLPVPYSIAYALGLVNEIKSRFGLGEVAFKHRDISTAYSNRAFSSNKAEDELGYTITPFASAVEKNKTFYQHL